MNTFPPAERDTRRGALLVALILALLAATLVGIAALSMAGSARLQRVTFGVGNRAYYLAESGAAQARVMRRLQPGLLPSGLFLLSNGDQFQITTVSNAGHIYVVSLGTALPGSRLEAQRRVTFEITESLKGAGVVPLGFDYNDDGNFDTDTWGYAGVDPVIRDTGPSGGQPALDLKGEEGLIYLTWQDDPNLNLANVWALNGGLLSYDMQVKIKPFETGNEQAYSKHYMLGLSFRLYPDSNHCYGVSFFRSLTGKEGKNPPGWVTTLPADFQALRGTNIELVLWYRNGGAFSLINHRTLTPADGVVDVRNGLPELRDYSTILLQLDEVYSASGRENRIATYVQGTNLYPLLTGSLTNAVWQEDATTFPYPVVWANGVVTNVDSRITSAYFSSNRPAEIGVHVFYDQTGANKKFYDDFALRLEGYGVQQTGSEIQY